MKEDWQICTIEQLGEIGRGRSKHRPRNDSILYGGEYPFIQTGDVKHSNLYITEYSDTYNEIGLAQSKLWKKGTLCITIAANIAETAILGMDACFPDSVVGFIPFENVADTKFVKYMMDIFKVYMQQISKGTTQDNLSLEKIRRVKFEVPPYKTQLRIVEGLSAFDDSIENNNKRIKVLEQLADNMYKEWFVRYRFPGYESVEFENGIPKGWERTRLKALAREVGKSEKADNKEKYKHYVPIDCLPQHSMALKEEDSIENASSSLVAFKKNDILFGAMRPYFHKVILSPFRGLTRSTCFVLDAVDDDYKYYLYMLMYQTSTVDYATTISVGSTMPYVKWKDFERMNVIRPSKNIVLMFNEIITPIIEEINNYCTANNNLIEQRDLLLSRLMNGKIQV